jgi:hypothetical protein
MLEHPDITAALRTGYPTQYAEAPPRLIDEDWEYEHRREEALLEAQERD